TLRRNRLDTGSKGLGARRFDRPIWPYPPRLETARRVPRQLSQFPHVSATTDVDGCGKSLSRARNYTVVDQRHTGWRQIRAGMFLADQAGDANGRVPWEGTMRITRFQAACAGVVLMAAVVNARWDVATADTSQPPIAPQPGRQAL